MSEEQKQMTAVEAALAWVESNNPPKPAFDLIFDYPRHDAYGRFSPHETSLRILAAGVRRLQAENEAARKRINNVGMIHATLPEAAEAAFE